jgi:hypothetical protein
MARCIRAEKRNKPKSMHDKHKRAGGNYLRLKPLTIPNIDNWKTLIEG